MGSNSQSHLPVTHILRAVQTMETCFKEDVWRCVETAERLPGCHGAQKRLIANTTCLGYVLTRLCSRARSALTARCCAKPSPGRSKARARPGSPAWRLLQNMRLGAAQTGEVCSDIQKSAWSAAGTLQNACQAAAAPMFGVAVSPDIAKEVLA